MFLLVSIGWFFLNEYFIDKLRHATWKIPCRGLDPFLGILGVKRSLRTGGGGGGHRKANF